jgi:formamidase
LLLLKAVDATMGKQEIRYAAKVSLDTPPIEQKVLHVSRTLLQTRALMLIPSRTAGTQTVHLPPHPNNQPATPANSHTVPFAGTIKNGEVVKIECLDWTGGQIGNNDSADDIRNVDLTRIHYLTGPFEIETAEPGDVLVVEIQDVQPLQEQPWGFTGIFSKENGGGFLDEIYPKPYVKIVLRVWSKSY